MSSNMNMLWDGVTGQIVIGNVREFNYNGTHSAITTVAIWLNFFFLLRAPFGQYGPVAAF